MDPNISSSSGAEGEERNFGDERLYKEALAPQFERLFLLTTNHDEDLEGIRADLNRMMEYVMRIERHQVYGGFAKLQNSGANEQVAIKTKKEMRRMWAAKNT
ncbi:hypothetical protein GH714_012085 [Hevea brasiliensis]|uniref:Uncharacterized protein n=1 Tax=Hevea brasiliensis TaxID=3981 RepID=A0A6A6MVM2_HEVBR|nr:hypothetical protein GH714_012085 [Hevea brasiliensis]